MKLLVGLGNPGPQYRETRHNVGFQVIDELARRQAVAGWRETFEALTARTLVAGQPTLLAKPVTFMNLSGRAVAGIAGYYRIEPADILIVLDEAALSLGRLRARRGGSAGGHNGLKSVIDELGTDQIPRLRIGVGRGDRRRDLADHILSTFEPVERETVRSAVLRAADAAEMFVAEGIERVMNAFNAEDREDPD